VKIRLFQTIFDRQYNLRLICGIYGEFSDSLSDLYLTFYRPPNLTTDD